MAFKHSCRTPSRDGPWTPQIAKNLTDQLVGPLNSKRYLLHDDGTKFTESFVRVVAQNDVDCVRIPPRSLNLNEHLARCIR